MSISTYLKNNDEEIILMIRFSPKIIYVWVMLMFWMRLSYYLKGFHKNRIYILNFILSEMSTLNLCVAFTQILFLSFFYV